MPGTVRVWTVVLAALVCAAGCAARRSATGGDTNEDRNGGGSAIDAPHDLEWPAAVRPAEPDAPSAIGAAGESGAGTAGGAAGESTAGERSAAAVVALVLERGDRVERVDAELRLDLTRADGARAQLGASLKMGRPDRFRLRSTKWGFLVADVVVRGDDAQALLSPVVREQALASAQASEALGRVLGSLVGWYGGVDEEPAGRSTERAAERFEVVDERLESIVVRVSKGEGAALEWTLARSDGRALQVRRFEDGSLTGVLDCSEHVDVDGVPLPTRLRFESAMGRIDVEVKAPRINSPLDDGTPADRSFEPPPGAIPLGEASA